MVQREAQIIREGFCEAQADEGQLGQEQQEAQHGDHRHRRPAEPLAGGDQALLLFADALVPENQIKHEGHDSRNQQHEPRDAPPPVLEGGQELVVQVHGQGFHLAGDFHRNAVVGEDQREAGAEGRDQRDPQIRNRQAEKG